MTCNCGRGCGEALSAADRGILASLRERDLAYLSNDVWEMVVNEVAKAGSVRATGGTAGRVLEDALSKASFFSRSEAGRYAADMRWKGESVDFPDAAQRKNNQSTSIVVNGQRRTFQGTEVDANSIKVGDLIGSWVEQSPSKVVGFVVTPEMAQRDGKPLDMITSPLTDAKSRFRRSMAPTAKVVKWEESTQKAFGGAGAGYGANRSEAGRYAAEQRWKGHVSAAEVRQQQAAQQGGGQAKDAKGALEAVAQRGAVSVPQEHVFTMLEELAKYAKDAKAKGKEAPDLDLCKVTIPNTNLFCGDNVGLQRDEMPQLSGKPIAGSKADSMPKDKKGRVNIGDAFVKQLEASGVKTVDGEVPAQSLRASQNQLIGSDVAGIMGALESGKMPPQTIFVSRDGYVIDGHHRWAATVGLDLKDGKAGDLKMKVRVIDMPIREVLAAANKFADDMGIPRRSGDPKKDKQQSGESLL